ncbi:MAG TPA: DNA polymerase, partial [Blastocatellia bacterium]|nr:DNA polymerase [Blastocatellia bacterium]
MPPSKRKRLFLVDGMSQVYRAFYALPSLSNSKGFPTNAIYGFTMMLRRLINEYKPDYLGVALDSSGPTFRHESYEAYKATRQTMPDDLSPQLPYITRVCEALRIPTTIEPRYEADDIIGTLARQAEQAGVDVVIVTNDKDMSQLVTDHVTILRTERTGEMKALDAAGVESKFGVRPDQIVDLLGLWGDTSDNIPGAPGVGEKGAKQIIQQYGTIEEAIAHADEISRKTYRESLKNNADLIRQSRELVTIACDMPIKLDLDKLIYEQPDRRAAYELFSELEFAQMAREFADAAVARDPGASAVADSAPVNYSRITTSTDLGRFVESVWSAEQVAIAVAERAGTLYGVALSAGAGQAALIDFERFESKGDPLKSVKEIFENGLVQKCVHDWKGALTLFDRYNCEADTEPLFRTNRASADGCIQDFTPSVRIESVDDDTLLAAYLLDPNRMNYRVKDTAREHLGVEMADAIEGFSEEDARALQTADLTLRIAKVLRAKIEEADLNRVYREIELPLVEILFEMERIGVRIDTAALDKAGREMEHELERLTAEIYKLAGEEFNINSPAQLGDIFERLNFEVGRKTKTGRISTSFDVLEELATKYELPKLIIEYRELAKLKNTYVDALPKIIDPRTGRVHTTLNQAVSATGRLSSTNPNLQNIPIRSEMGRRIRA